MPAFERSLPACRCEHGFSIRVISRRAWLSEDVAAPEHESPLAKVQFLWGKDDSFFELLEFQAPGEGVWPKTEPSLP
jgi:hypothetical protein